MKKETKEDLIGLIRAYLAIPWWWVIYLSGGIEGVTPPI